jgi:hypothetical protein
MTNELINKENKKLLKNANAIGFRLNQDGTSQIECHKEINVEGFKTKVTEVIPVDTSISIYEGGYNASREYEVEKGFCSIQYSYDNLQWQTIVKNLKMNDQIILEWLVGNNSNTLDNYNLSNDELHLKIKRNDKVELMFLIDNRITEKNSLARMIKIRKKY